jgi:beta-phosphoglucomutase-like phosphatase (HAD superfamily)
LFPQILVIYPVLDRAACCIVQKDRRTRQGAVFKAAEKYEGNTMTAQHRIRAVIWDLDGVILRSSNDAEQSVQVVRTAGLRHPVLHNSHIDHNLLGFITAMRPVIHTALLVNSWSEVYEIVDLRRSLVPAFDRVIQALSGTPRHDPRLFAMAAVRLGIPAAQVALVDDDRQRVEAARQAGMQAFEFESPAQIGSQLMGLLAETVN